HGELEADEAVKNGADLCGVGPIYTGRTRPDLHAAGVSRLASFIKDHPTVPHLAIGGITLERLPELIEVGCRGIAVCEAVCAAASPGDVIRRCRTLLESEAIASS
ncbi:MAG: thiamine phosphate synthase, partial [Phycisphaerales bacterium]|nr:thiamine phosphate synthase [Phycisphaerales bacterium]